MTRVNDCFVLAEETAAKKDNSDKMLLDMCSIRAEPVLNFYVEHIGLPKNEIKQFNMKLEGIETAAGLVILSKSSKVAQCENMGGGGG